MNDTVKPDKLLRAYFKAKTAHEEAQKAADVIEADMKELKLAMKDYLLAQGTKGTKTEFGSITMMKSTRYFTNDYLSLDAFINEHDIAPSHLFEHRIAQKNMAQFLDEHPGVVPPGLNSETEFSVRVSRPTAAS